MAALLLGLPGSFLRGKAHQATFQIRALEMLPDHGFPLLERVEAVRLPERPRPAPGWYRLGFLDRAVRLPARVMSPVVGSSEPAEEDAGHALGRLGAARGHLEPGARLAQLGEDVERRKRDLELLDLVRQERPDRRVSRPHRSAGQDQDRGGPHARARARRRIFLEERGLSRISIQSWNFSLLRKRRVEGW